MATPGEEGFQCGEAEGPDPAGSVEQLGDVAALEPASAAEGEAGVERRLGNANFAVGRRDLAFGGRNVGPALKEFRWHTDGNHRRLDVKWADGRFEVRCGQALQGSHSMFELGTLL